MVAFEGVAESFAQELTISDEQNITSDTTTIVARKVSFTRMVYA